MSLADLRKEYTYAGLRRVDLMSDPVEQFAQWLSAAIAADVSEPTAAALATADGRGVPSVRTVLLKGADSRGFVFFTNYESRKGRELAINPHAAMVWHWRELERQVTLSGTAARISREESAAYFKTRPAGSQYAAWVSHQTEVIENREALEKKAREVQEIYSPEAIPLPPYWGGFVVRPVTLEFWQGRPSRLHDRFRYTREGELWKVERLAP